jgi:hypothetical protein
MIDQSRPFVFSGSNVLFLGRSASDYFRMFGLSLPSLAGKKLLDCASGPAAFVAEANRLGLRTVGCDPKYGRTVRELQDVIDNHFRVSYEALAYTSAELFDPAAFGNESYRKEVASRFRTFLDDYQLGRGTRYVAGKLPCLPFKGRSFDIALVSNLLFLYTNVSQGGLLSGSGLTYSEHLLYLVELLRVAHEACIYPLKGPNSSGAEHLFLPALLDDLKQRGVAAEYVPVEYRCYRDANWCLRLRAP